MPSESGLVCTVYTRWPSASADAIGMCIAIVSFFACLGHQQPDDKYAAEEKAVVDDEIMKTVTERRMEIEHRLTGEPVVAVVDRRPQPEPWVKENKQPDVPPVEPIEPTEASFEHKRMSFERGVSIEQVLHEDVPVREKSAVSEEKKMPSIDEKPVAATMADVLVDDVDATSLTFHEKRLSFEQGIPVKEIIQKKTEEFVSALEQGFEHEKQSTPDDLEKTSETHGKCSDTQINIWVT